MKKYIVTITAVLLATVMLAGCAVTKVNTHNAPVKATPVPVTPTCAPSELTRGTIEGSVYTNESADIEFTAPEGWVFFSDEEITVVSDGAYTCDMVANNKLTNSSLMVEFTDLGGTDMDEEAFLDLFKDDSKGIYNFEYGKWADTMIGPNTFKAITIASSNDSLIQYYYVHRAGNYMISITVILPKDGDLDSIMANFS